MAPFSVAERVKWPDWAVADREILRKVHDEIGLVPGIHLLDDGTPIAHRTHLPVLPGHAVPDVLTCPAGVTLIGDRHLHRWQIEDHRFIRERRGTLLANEPRTGKTGTVVASHDLDNGPLWVICPLDVVPVWQEWIALRWLDENPYIMEGLDCDPAALKQARIVIGHWDVLPAWQVLGLRCGMLVLDEAHVLSNKRSLRSQAVTFMSIAADKVVCVTGSPVWNEASGLYTMLQACNPGAWGSWWDFAARYAGLHRERYGAVLGGPTHIEELKARLTEVVRRRQWRDLQADLPPIHRSLIQVDLDDTALRDIDLLATPDKRTSLVARLVRLRRVLAEAKREAVLRDVELQVKAGHAVVVWTWHKPLAYNLGFVFNDRNIKTWIVTGEISAKERKHRFADFRSCTDPCVLVCTMAVGQVGIDLSRADSEVFAELDWTPAVVAQAEMRPYSPSRSLTVKYAMTNHPVETAIVEALLRKAETGSTVGLPLFDGAAVLGDVLGQRGPDLERLRRTLLRSAMGEG